MSVVISGIEKGSIAEKKKIKKGHTLISINKNEIFDVLDYRFYLDSVRLDLSLLDENGKPYSVKIKKPEYEDIGLEFCTYLMDKHQSCKNKCIFCFIDQLPKGMRESLYFKDDDSRLSFLFGNYITLTNITDREVSRIIKMHISPVNISVHTTNGELRKKMMNNRFADRALDILNQFAAHGIKMNCQIVLCKGINDGEELRRTITDLSKLIPAVQSVAIVPVGLTKYREGLYPLELFQKEDAIEVINLVDSMGDGFLREYGNRFCYLADEFYIKAGKEPPEYEYYGDFEQLENGIGLWRSLEDEFMQALEEREPSVVERKLSVVTGTLAYPLIRKLCDEAQKKFSGLNVFVYAIKNEFFGENINVAGLVTGGDIIKQVKNKELGEKLLLPSVMLKSDEDVFLDDVTLDQLIQELGVPVEAKNNDGYELLSALID